MKAFQNNYAEGKKSVDKSIYRVTLFTQNSIKCKLISGDRKHPSGYLGMVAKTGEDVGITKRFKKFWR